MKPEAAIGHVELSWYDGSTRESLECGSLELVEEAPPPTQTQARASLHSIQSNCL